MLELHYCGWNWWFPWTTSDVQMHRYQQCRYYFEVFLGSSKYVWPSQQSANWPGTPGVLALYYQLFYVMEDEGIVHRLNDLHVVVFHHVFLQKIPKKLSMWNRARLQHRLRTVRSSPVRMWVAGQLQTPVGIEF